MSKFILNICLPIVLLCTTCSKIDLDSQLADPAAMPVFFIEATIDGTPLNLQAGNNGFVMLTSFEQDDNSSRFIGELAHKSGCDVDCRSLKVTLYNVPVDSADGLTSSANKEFSLAPEIDSGNHILYHFEPVTESEIPGLIHSWEIAENGQTAELNESPSINYSIEGIPAPFTLTLTTTTPSGCTSSHTKYIDPAANTPQQCDCNISVETFEFDTTFTSNCGDSVTWTDDTEIYSGSSTISTTNNNSGDIICLEVTDGNNNSCNSCGQFFMNNAGTGLDFCKTSFSTERTDSPLTDTLQTSYISIEYTSSDGVKYSTALANQNENSTFQLLNAVPYLRNDMDQATRILSLQTNCLLANSDGTVVNLEILTGEFGIAHPD